MRIRQDLPRRRGSIVAISVAIGIAASASAARAQSAEAEALFDDGNKLMAEGKLPQACDAFDASNRAEPRAGTLIRLGECREQNHQLASAWSAYRDALTRVKDPRKRDYATAKATAVEPRLSYLTVAVPDRSRIDGLTILRNGKSFDVALWSRPLPVDGGDYVIVCRAVGHEAWQTTALVPLEGGKVTVDVPRLKELAPAAAPPRAVPASPTVPLARRAEPPTPPVGGVTQRRKIALGGAIVSLGALTAGVALGVSAQTKQDDAYKLCPDPATPCDRADQSNALIKTSRDRALAADLAFAGAAAVAIGAGVLWFTGAPRTEDAGRVSIAPRVVPGETGLVLAGTF